MKKSLGLITGLLVSFCSLHAQRPPSKIFAEVSIGPSFPLGQFAEKSFPGIEEKDQPGMASVGVNANVTGGYYVKENIGVLLSVGYSTYKQKTEGYSHYFKRNWYLNATEVTVEADHWKMLKVMAGGFLVTPISEDKINLVTKLSAGILKTDVPKYSWEAYAATGSAFAGGEMEKEKLSATFCYQISLGLQFKMNERVHLLFDINSFNAAATKDAPAQIGIPIPGVPSMPDRKYKFGSVNALLGVGLNF